MNNQIGSSESKITKIPRSEKTQNGKSSIKCKKQIQALTHQTNTLKGLLFVGTSCRGFSGWLYSRI